MSVCVAKMYSSLMTVARPAWMQLAHKKYENYLNHLPFMLFLTAILHPADWYPSGCFCHQCESFHWWVHTLTGFNMQDEKVSEFNLGYIVFSRWGRAGWNSGGLWPWALGILQGT